MSFSVLYLEAKGPGLSNRPGGLEGRWLHYCGRGKVKTGSVLM